ncbi:MAG TPA: PAS domain S-box protein [Prolixibacteraceae bacterium]|jgi:PAS domain S-box-containing protein
MNKGDEQFRILFEKSTDGIFIADNQGHYLDVNPAGCKMLGYTREEIIKMSIGDIITEDESERVVPEVQIILRDGSIKNHWKFKRKDQTVFVGEVTGTRLSDGHLLGVLRNVTEQMLEKKVLSRNGERSRLTLDYMLEGCQIIGFDWRYLYLNHMAEIHNRRPNEELLGNRFLDMWPGIEETEVFAIIRHTLEERIPQRQEVKFTFPDGDIGWFNLSIQPVPEGVFILSVDITTRKQADEALKLSEERYRNIFESAVIGLYRTTPEGEILLANSTLIKMLGFESFEDLSQRNLEKEGFEGSEHRQKFRQRIEKEGRVIGLEAIWKTKSGKPVFVNENARAFYDHKGQVIYYEGTIEDITERKKMERTLRESEEKFRKAFLTNPDSIAINSLDNGKFISVNNGFTQIFEFTEKEVLGKTSVELNIWQNPEERKTYVKGINEKGIIENFETKLYTKSGKLKNTLISAAIIELDGLSNILSTIKDITERKLAEEAMRESEEKYRSIFENSSVAILLTSTDGYILSANDFACKLFGRSKDEMHKATRDSIIDSSDPRLAEMLEERKRTGSVKGELRFIKKDGSYFHGELSSVIFNDMDGNERSSMVIRDLTAKKKIEEEIKNLNLMLEQRILDRTAQLKEANLELEAFSYSVSHDLRAPLRHINGFVDLLSEKYQDLLPEKGRHYLEVIIAASRQMGTLIDDLLQFSRTGRQEMQETNLDMNFVLQEVLKLLAPDLEDRKIEWEIAPLPLLKADHSLLRMVWYNLLSNAVKFTKAKDPAVIQIGVIEEQKEHVFFVRDNGAGFDMRYAHKLFGVFQRLHSKDEFEGTGIGLANVRRIILKHGGRTWAESQPDQGATFYFTIPINEGETK